MNALRLGLIGLALCATAFAARASTVTYTIEGSVIGGNDAAGLFGGGDLADDPFTAVTTFEPAKAQSSWSNARGSGANGGSFANGLRFASVTLTINQLTTRFSDYTSTLSSSAGAQANLFVQSSAGPGAKNDIGFYIASSLIKADYTQPNLADGLNDRYAGYFTLTDAGGAQVVWANFEVSRLSVVNPVPLPASAPLFGAGLLALAAAGYRQHRDRRALIPACAAPRDRTVRPAREPRAATRP